MEREILVSADARETRVALLESGTVMEAAVERHADRSRVGNVYKARVNRVLPGMQSAFVDVGLERDAFLHVTDFAPATGHLPSHGPAQRIERLLKVGETLLVQLAKEAIAGKGARVTTGLTLPGRYLVLAPIHDADAPVDGIGVSELAWDAKHRELMPLQNYEDLMWGDNRCAASTEVRRFGKSTCKSGQCEPALTFCRINGGRHWPDWSEKNRRPRQTDFPYHEYVEEYLSAYLGEAPSP